MVTRRQAEAGKSSFAIWRNTGNCREESAPQDGKSMNDNGDVRKLQTEFLANISHELRTPMNAIIGMVDLSLADRIPPAVRDYLSTARTSAYALLSLLDDLIDYSRIEAHQFELEFKPFCLRPLLAGLGRLLTSRAEEKGLDFAIHVDSQVPDLLVGDARRIRQLLQHVVVNGIKFTDRGRVDLRVKPVNETSSEATIAFMVEDTGSGISADYLKQIFEPFTQIDASSTRTHSGIGLGLAIVRELAHAMNGDVTVQSEVGQGSLFTVTMTIPKSSGRLTGEDLTEDDRQAPPRPLARLRILAAEDTPANQKLLVAILTRRGHSIDVVSNGQEALQRLEVSDYDMILMDVQMPVMDGLQATTAIRALPSWKKSHTPIIALTAHVLRGDRERCRTAGMDAYLSKPVETDELIRRIELLAVQGRRENEVSDRPVLNRSEPGGFVGNVHNGKKTSLKGNSRKQSDGRLSIRGPFPDDDRMVLADGCATGSVATLVSEKADSVSENSSPSHRLVIDRDAALRRLGADETLFGVLAGFFCDDAPQLLNQLKGALDKNDQPEATRLVHSIKGLAATFSSDFVTRVAGMAEQAGRVGNLEEVRKLLPRIEDELRIMYGELKKFAPVG